MKPKLKVLDLFSGIGGFSLGLERTGGFETVAFCEIEPFPRRVLAKYWPEVPCYDDVRTLTAARLAADGIAVDVITGGFPCQDVSVAGKQEGLGTETRSGLFSEIIRLICELRPTVILLENVSNLLAGPSDKPGAWFGRVLSSLAECGYDAQWESIPARFVGLPHGRGRVWIVAYPVGSNVEGLDVQKSLCAYPKKSCRREFARAIDACLPADDYRRLRGDHDGVSEVLGQLKAYGNAVVPQIPELIGHAILDAIGWKEVAA